jgi:putrescine importer
LIVSNFGAGLACTLGAAKLLYGMGRDNVLPAKLFGYVAPGTSTPTYNIILVGVLSLIIAVLLDYVGNAYQHAGELINFGAFVAFMGVNLATFWQFGVLAKPGSTRSIWIDVLLPLSGFGFCALIWWNLGTVAQTAGGTWFATGLIYLAIKTRGFRPPQCAGASRG